MSWGAGWSPLAVAAVVVSLPARAERLAAFTAAWEAGNAAGPPLRVQPAVDLPADPALGCLASHILALSSTWAGPVAVFEDDAVCDPALLPHGPLVWPDPPPDWALLRLGGDVRGPRTPATPGWVQPAAVFHTHAYIARHPQALAGWLARTGMTNVSLALNAYRPGTGGRGVQYAAWPPRIGQAAGRSDITGEPVPARWWTKEEP